jgi:hypothetical protein
MSQDGTYKSMNQTVLSHKKNPNIGWYAAPWETGPDIASALPIVILITPAISKTVIVVVSFMASRNNLICDGENFRFTFFCLRWSRSGSEPLVWSELKPNAIEAIPHHLISNPWFP